MTSIDQGFYESGEDPSCRRCIRREVLVNQKDPLRTSSLTATRQLGPPHDMAEGDVIDQDDHYPRDSFITDVEDESGLDNKS